MANGADDADMRGGNVFATVAVLAVAVATVLHAQEQSPSTAVIQEPITIRVPLAPCAAGALAHRILISTRQLGGIEFAPGPCMVGTRQPQPPPLPAQLRPEDVTLQGLTVREALDRIVALDPRYRWMETNRLIVMRPATAWDDPQNFLHKTINGLDLQDESMYDALGAIQTAIGPIEIRNGLVPHTPESARPISLHLGTTSPFEALNAIVRAHGALVWSVTYCQPPTRHENATIGFRTFDGSGTGDHVVFLRDADGKSYDPCRRR